jgi:PBP1b-binding outer membrane lipoprotein LpoB
MKKLLAILVFAASFSACTDGTHPEEKATDTIPVTTAPMDATVDTSSMKMDTSSKMSSSDTATVK